VVNSDRACRVGRAPACSGRGPDELDVFDLLQWRQRPLVARLRKLRVAAMSAAAVETLTLQERTERLEALAEAFENDYQAWPDLRLTAELAPLAHSSLTGERLLGAFEDWCDQRETLTGVETGNVEWQSINPHLTCPDPHTVACEIQEQNVADALDTLLYGDR
jgi:hypothetical protein